MIEVDISRRGPVATVVVIRIAITGRDAARLGHAAQRRGVDVESLVSRQLWALLSPEGGEAPRLSVVP